MSTLRKGTEITRAPTSTRQMWRLNERRKVCHLFSANTLRVVGQRCHEETLAQPHRRTNFGFDDTEDWPRGKHVRDAREVDA